MAVNTGAVVVNKTITICSSVGREKFVRGILSASPLVQDKEQDKTRERIHLYKPAASTHTHQTQCTGTKSGQIKTSSLDSVEIAGSTNGHVKPCSQNKKRPRKHQVGDSGHHSPPVKRASSSPALTAGDLDLLNSYWCFVSSVAEVHSLQMCVCVWGGVFSCFSTMHCSIWTLPDVMHPVEFSFHL